MCIRDRLEGCLGAGEGKVLRDVRACCLALWRRNMAANEAAEVKAADFPQHESPADGRGDEMAHPKVSDKDGGPGEASWAAAAGLVFGKPIATVDRTCCANGSGEAPGKIGVWLGRHETQVGGAGCQPCQHDKGTPRGHEPSDERKGLAAARREPAGVVEVDQQETARGIAGKPTGCDARFALNDLSPTPGILQAGGRAAVRVRRRLGIPERIFGLCDGRKRQKGSTRTC